MRAPAFWWLDEPNVTANLLRPIAWAYGAIAQQIMQRTGAKIKAPVICIGNFVVGGAGKTPTAMAIAQMLYEMEQTPFFLSRGYGGRLSTKTPLTIDAEIHSAADVGDEPLLLARIAPTIICTDRVAGAQAAVDAGASIIIMDDGLQNPSLTKTLTLAVIDGGVGIGNGLCLPAGPLRAPMIAQWRAVKALIMVGSSDAGERLAKRAYVAGRDVIDAKLAPNPAVAAALRGKRVFAFAGIGRPEKLFETLRDCGAELVGTSSFADHHAYTQAELEGLRSDAAAHNAELIVTTEKDAMRIARESSIGIVALPVVMTFQDEGRIQRLLAALIKP